MRYQLPSLHLLTCWPLQIEQLPENLVATSALQPAALVLMNSKMGSPHTCIKRSRYSQKLLHTTSVALPAVSAMDKEHSFQKLGQSAYQLLTRVWNGANINPLVTRASPGKFPNCTQLPIQAYTQLKGSKDMIIGEWRRTLTLVRMSEFKDKHSVSSDRTSALCCPNSSRNSILLF